MCTAVVWKGNDHYFGRNLDLEYSYKEEVTIVPRNFPLMFRKQGEMRFHFAMIGMAYVPDLYPLFYEAVNEKGLGMAGLSFSGFARYMPMSEEKENIAPFELIPWILSQCSTVEEARWLLDRIHIADFSYSSDLPNTPLHWMIADRHESIVVECLEEGMKVWDNPVGVLTNNPPFDFQLLHLNHYLGLSCHPLQNRMTESIDYPNYSRGMGAMGLPGDFSSASRFVRAVFVKENIVSRYGEVSCISTFFHILDSVSQKRGCVVLENGKYVITVYSSCCNMEKGIYYYKTYEDSQIISVDMHMENLDGEHLVRYPIEKGEKI